MRNVPQLRLTPKALLVALVSACYPLSGFAAAGKVEFAVGNVVAVGPDGRSRPLTKGTDIDTGDTIQTGSGRAQVRFIDGGFISLTPDTEFKVSQYNYPGKADGTEKGLFGLVKGGLRAVTGAIGHVNKQNYQVDTPVATIGIRGTEFLATMIDNKLIVRVGDGAIYVVNAAGTIVLYKGQSGEVDGINTPPAYSNEVPLVNAAGPRGSTPGALREEQRLEQPLLTDYIAGIDTTSTGTSCELVGGCVTSSTSSLDYLVANSLNGTYNIVSFTAPVDGAGNVLSTNAVTGSFQAHFGTGVVDNFNMNAGTVGTVNGASGSLSGSSFNASGGSVFFGSAGSFSATGQLFGSSAAQAGVSYQFTDGASSASGSAVFQQTSLTP
jgi:hypothetical protein